MTTTASMSPSLMAESSAAAVPVASSDWPALPTETEIYILPDGRVVIADLPAELGQLAAALGVVEVCEIEPDVQPDPSL